jgi:hypothetical protein
MLKQYWKESSFEEKATIVVFYLVALVLLVLEIRKHSFVAAGLTAVLVVAQLVRFFWMVRSLGKTRTVFTARPVVYSCDVDDVIGLCPESYFLLAAARKQLIEETSVICGGQPQKIRVCPDAMLFFPKTRTAEAAIGSGSAGGKKDYDRIIVGCTVVPCEMFVPSSSHRAMTYRVRALSLDAGWRLIHHRAAPSPDLEKS